MERANLDDTKDSCKNYFEQTELHTLAAQLITSTQAPGKHVNLDDRKESCKSYLEQTKLLVTLASASLLASAAWVASQKITVDSFWFRTSEGAFVASLFLAYFVLGSITGSQRRGHYDVYDFKTRLFSTLQFFAYVLGAIAFVLML